MLSLRDSLEARLGGRYAIEGEIGSGATSHVYLAHPVAGGERIVIKVLRTRMSNARGVDHDTLEEHFLLEMRILQTLRHPRIVPIIEAGEAAGRLFFTMPYIDGETLRDRIAVAGALPLRDALRVARDVADALGHAHASGVIHKDVKPENILLSADGAYLLDFGLAEAPSLSYLAAGAPSRSVAGTPEYMSPEQVNGEDGIDRRTDLFSLGCVLFEMLCGRSPYSSRGLDAARLERERDSAPDIRAHCPDVPDAVDRIVRRSIAARPSERYPNAGAMVRAIDEALGG